MFFVWRSCSFVSEADEINIPTKLFLTIYSHIGKFLEGGGGCEYIQQANHLQKMWHLEIQAMQISLHAACV